MNAFAAPLGGVSALFPPPAERQRHDDFLTAALEQAARRVADGPVGPTLDQEAFLRELEAFDFEAPRPLSDLLPWTIERLETGLVHLTHPRYFGLFNPAPTFPSQCADRIVASFNPQLATAKTSPAAVAIEGHVIAAIARRAGFPADAVGHFTTGGSEANLTALICALTRADPRFAAEGVRGLGGAPLVYVSEDAHQAWQKIVHQTGLGRACLRLVETDEYGRMVPRTLSRQIAEDRAAGYLPVMIAATAGTTGAGTVDPLEACAAIAGREHIWLHIDAAWGGALLASERLRRELAGIERADSFTIDAHKWFATTMGCGMFVTRHRDVPSDAFHADTPYMPSSARYVDPYVTTAQWSRRFLGLRLFLSLAAAGWRGYGDHVDRAVDLIAWLREELLATGWTIVNASPMAVLCVLPPPAFPDVASIARDIVASKRAWIASTVFRRQLVLRICVTNGQTMPADILALANLLQSFGDGASHPTVPEIVEFDPMTAAENFDYPVVIDDICRLDWRGLSADDMVSVAWAYYYFSIQFRENLEIARALYPTDDKLVQLEREECNTDNLSPWPGVTEAGEAVNHDEFMRRTIGLLAIEPRREARLKAIGEAYLADMRAQDPAARAASIASYEDGGLETVFTAILKFGGWESPMLKAFQHFLAQHVMFDSDPEQGHGALSRHITVDDRVLPMWKGFKRLFVESVPALVRAPVMMAAE